MLATHSSQVSRANMTQMRTLSEDMETVVLEEEWPFAATPVVDDSLVPLLAQLHIEPTPKNTGMVQGGVAIVQPPRWKKYEKARTIMNKHDRQRLDNIVWRAWHMHYALGIRTGYFEFAEQAPAEKKEAANMCYPILEGRNDDERVQEVFRQYMSWRVFWKNRTHGENQPRRASEPPQQALWGLQDMKNEFMSETKLPVGDEWMGILDFDDSNLTFLMDTIPDTLFSTLPNISSCGDFAQLERMSRMEEEISKDFNQPRKVKGLLKSSTSASYHDFLSSQLIDQQRFPGIKISHTKPVPLEPHRKATKAHAHPPSSNRNHQVERPWRKHDSRAPYAQGRHKSLPHHDTDSTKMPETPSTTSSESHVGMRRRATEPNLQSLATVLSSNNLAGLVSNPIGAMSSNNLVGMSKMHHGMSGMPQEPAMDQGDGLWPAPPAPGKTGGRTAVPFMCGPPQLDLLPTMKPEESSSDEPERGPLFDLSEDEEEEEEILEDGGPPTVAEAKRHAHILAEQKRRNNIRLGFEELQNILPSSGPTKGNQKLSKAIILQKTIEQIQALENQKQQMLEEATRLHGEISALKLSINQFQHTVPPHMQPPEAHHSNSLRLYHEWASAQSAQSMKFVIFLMVIEGLYESFLQSVQVDRPETLGHSFTAWFIQNCSPQNMRDRVQASMHRMAQRLFPSNPTAAAALTGTSLPMAFPFNHATAVAMAALAQATQMALYSQPPMLGAPTHPPPPPSITRQGSLPGPPAQPLFAGHGAPPPPMFMNPVVGYPNPFAMMSASMPNLMGPQLLQPGSFVAQHPHPPAQPPARPPIAPKR